MTQVRPRHSEGYWRMRLGCQRGPGRWKPSSWPMCRPSVLSAQLDRWGHSGGPPPRVGPGGVEGRGEATSLELAADDWRTRRRPGERCSWSQSVREKQKTIRCCPYTGSRAFQVTAATRGATPECSPHAVSVEVLCASFQKVLQTAEHFVKLHARGVLTQQHLRAAHIRLPLEHLTRRLPGESRW